MGNYRWGDEYQRNGLHFWENDEMSRKASYSYLILGWSYNHLSMNFDSLVEDWVSYQNSQANLLYSSSNANLKAQFYWQSPNTVREVCWWCHWWMWRRRWRGPKLTMILKLRSLWWTISHLTKVMSSLECINHWYEWISVTKQMRTWFEAEC